jgi:hypothetical protein
MLRANVIALKSTIDGDFASKFAENSRDEHVGKDFRRKWDRIASED